MPNEGWIDICETAGFYPGGGFKPCGIFLTGFPAVGCILTGLLTLTFPGGVISLAMVFTE